MRYLLAILLTLAANAASAQTLIHHWMEPGWTPSANTTITAAVGAVNLTLANAGNVDSIDSTDVPGTAFAASLYMNQSDSNDVASGAATISGSAARSICGWFKGDAAPGSGSITRIWHSSNDVFASTWSHTNASYRGAAFRFGDGSYPVASYSTLNSGTWYHLAAVWTGTQLRVFKDGVQIGSDVATSTTTSDASTFYVGNNNLAAQGFVGKVVDVRIYSGSLDASAIATIIAEADASAVVDPLSTSIPGISRDPLTGTIPGL